MIITGFKAKAKYVYSFLLMHCISLVFQNSVMASSSGGGQNKTTNEQYLEQLKEFYTVDVNQISSLDWFLKIAAALGSVACLLALMHWIWKLVYFFIEVRLARADLRDTRFWKNMAWYLLLIIFFMGGFTFVILSQLYQFFEEQGGIIL